MNHAFSFPTDVRLGPGVRSLLAGALAEAGVKRPLVVTDDGVVTLGFFQQIAEGLAADGRLEPATFAGVHGNPTESQVAAGLEAYRAHGADGIVAVGGGAPTDVAKAIGLVATNEGAILEYADDAIEPRAPTRPTPWIAALPTTAGTGSEVGRSSVISEEDTHRKRVVFQPVMLPRLVLADPELLVGLPAKLTAATGMDALTHLIEAYLATGYHPMCDGIAVEGVLLVKGALARSVDAPGDLEARGAMLMASMMGAVAFQKGLGINHACAHALSAVLGTHHGLANAVMLEDALRFNAGEPACAKRMARLARALELGGPSADGFCGWVASLREAVGIASGAASVGVTDEHLDALCDFASRDACMDTTPRPADGSQLRALFAGESA